MDSSLASSGPAAESPRVPSRRERMESWALATIVAACGVIAAWQSWNRWLDPIIDTGRDLYIPEQLLRGARLYRDIRYQYPPLAPYLLAAITRITGSSLNAYAAIGIAQSIAIASILFALGRKLAGRWAGFAAALSFVTMNFCGASTFGANFVFPYSYAATFGVLLLLLFIAAVAMSRPWFAIVAAVAASCCKVEYLIAVILTAIALTIAGHLRVRHLAALAVSMMATATLAIGFFGLGPLRDNIFASSLTHGEIARRFFSVVGGTADWQGSLLDAAGGVAAIVLVVFLLHREWRLSALLVALLLGAFMNPASFFRAWGLLQWIAAAWALTRSRSDPWLLPLSALSIAATLRIPLNVAPVWYGFALVVPTYLLIGYVLFHLLPERGLYSRQLAVIWIALIAALSVRSLIDEHTQYSFKKFPIVSGRGTFYDWNQDRARALNQFLPTPIDTLAVMPEGLTINYLMGVRTPLTFHTLTPPEMVDASTEDQVVRELIARPPSHIAIVSRDVGEYGRHAFGVDYDIRIASWIQGHYTPATAYRSDGFSLYLLRRR